MLDKQLKNLPTKRILHHLKFSLNNGILLRHPYKNLFHKNSHSNAMIITGLGIGRPGSRDLSTITTSQGEASHPTPMTKGQGPIQKSSEDSLKTLGILMTMVSTLQGMILLLTIVTFLLQHLEGHRNLLRHRRRLVARDARGPSYLRHRHAGKDAKRCFSHCRLPQIIPWHNKDPPCSTAKTTGPGHGSTD